MDYETAKEYYKSWFKDKVRTYLQELQLENYELDQEVYNRWLQDKIVAIEAMSRDELQARIVELTNIEFYVKREWGMIHQQWDKITGRKGIPRHLLEDRDKLRDQNYVSVNVDGEPRQKAKEKKAKRDKLDIKSLLGIDVDELNDNIKKSKKKSTEPDNVSSDIQSLLAAPKPKEIKPELTPEEKEAKANDFRERMRLAKEKNQQNPQS